MADYDVIVCGAGVGGLTLAAALGRRGLRVLVVEKQKREVVVHKGELLQPRSVQILDAVGGLAPLHDRGAVSVHALECRSAGGSLVGFLDYTLLGAPFDAMLLHYYSDNRASLLSVADEVVEIRRGARVTGLLRGDGGRVAGVRVASGASEREISAHLTVGADGRVSAVRTAAGIAAQMEQYDHHLVAFDIQRAPQLEPRVTAFLTRQGGPAALPAAR